MNKATFSLLSASLLTLAACGGTADDNAAAANDSVDAANDLVLPPDETVDPIGNDLTFDANVADLEPTETNAIDMNVAADANLATDGL